MEGPYGADQWVLRVGVGERVPARFDKQPGGGRNPARPHRLERKAVTEQKSLSAAQRADIARQPVMTAEEAAALVARVRINREEDAAMPTEPLRFDEEE